MCKALSCFEHFRIVGYSVNGCISISAFTLLVTVPVGIKDSKVVFKICAITTRI